MEYRRLGRTGLRVSLTSLGTGGPSKLGQTKGATPTDARMLLRRALDRGINFIDTAPDYGNSEARIGRYISSRRNEYSNLLMILNRTLSFWPPL